MKQLLTLCFLLLGTLIFAQSTTSPVGRWQTKDDDTGEVKSIVEIYEVSKGKYEGKIVEILTNNKDAVCDKCEGKQKGKPMLGLIIITDLKPKSDYWANGEILDPQKGSTYGLSAWYEDGDANKLYIRGKHWTGLYRTQEWTRAR